MRSIVSSLKLVPIDQMDLHEDFEPSRLEKTVEAIKRDDCIRHPILVTKLANGRYFVLDGVHRFMSLKKLQLETAPVQEVSMEDFTMTTWAHLVKKGEWFEEMIQHDNLPWKEAKKEGTPFIEVVANDKERYYLYEEDIAPYVLESWHKIVTRYSENQEVTRVPSDIETLLKNDEVLIKYSRLRYEAVEQIVMEGKKLPAGVTRFQVSGRILNLCVPLALLQKPHRVSEKWLELLHQSEKSLRCYEEKVYVFE
ncbi:ParB N-terminal domain-containing protein [Bacillus kexueae]|uniref:ParB N-terminal domain-containing protein n=1 Tax=Aeribacillus kexueae TaxID=2078952 RepID=UPI001FAEB1A3|nr:ParB N-terminal domain-containing protein [Bacillus kexueae]